MKIAVVAAACIFIASPAGADEIPGTFYTGNQVHDLCRQGVAWGYVAGLHDAHVLAANALQHIQRTTDALKDQVPSILGTAVDFQVKWVGRYCAPHGATVEQMTDVFCKFLRDNPQERHLSATALFPAAMMVWPCPELQQ
jgi:hypothetical protein